MFAWLPKSIDADGVSKRVEILGNWYGSKQAGKIWNEIYDRIVVMMNFRVCISGLGTTNTSIKLSMWMMV